MPPPAKIDVHAHFVPPEYTIALRETGHACPDGHIAEAPSWSEDEHLSLMKTINATKTILSITSPGTHLRVGDDQSARKLTRYCNEFAADIKERRPDQFGFWASLPLPDVQGSLAEIEYAQDTLNADGFALETNHHGTYLGNPAFDQVFDELNRRKAIVFIHPTTPCHASGQIAVPMRDDIPRPLFEFFFDTARAAMNLFMSGTVSRCPDVTFILSHLGGALPPLINRFAAGTTQLGLPGIDPSLSPAWVKERLNAQFYFDTAGFALPDQIQGLLPYVTVDRLLYGSDYPFTPLRATIMFSNHHEQFLPSIVSDQEERDKIYWKNASKLLHKQS